MDKLTVDVWSDIVCPWCYIGKRRLEAALADFPQRESVAVTWHSFELDPAAGKGATAIPFPSSYVERLARKYGTSLRDAEARIAQVTELAAAEGLEFHLDRSHPSNTFDGHRVLHMAHGRGPAVQGAVKERLFRGYFTEGEVIGDVNVLARLAGESGLDSGEVRTMLASDAYTAEVRADEGKAAAIGIRGVPFFVFDNKYAVSGAHPAEVLLAALNQAWSARAGDESASQSAAGTVCGPAGCP